jgi:lipopolysaccharide/colanic/teichoic acid biosynthesis glycosyltransferase
MMALPQGSRVSAKRASVRRVGAMGQDQPVECLLSQELFRDALVRERKRADRFEEALVLVFISLSSRAAGPSAWGHLVGALLQSKLDTDVIGWFEQGAVLGLVRSLAAGDSRETATTLAGTVLRELASGLTRDTVDGFSIRSEIYDPSSGSIPPVLFDAESQRRTPHRIAIDAGKRALDVAGSTALLVACSPVFLVVPVLVKLKSKGPVFFRQERVGQAGQPFTMLKFRTMHQNADSSVHQRYVEKLIQPGNTSGSGTNTAARDAPQDPGVFKIVNDSRVTSFGHFLRKSSLDELPQLWNVLRGEMSLVGPRPPLPYEVARYKRWHLRRVLEAKPGITGLWQVTGRSQTTFDEMVRLDLRYARTPCVWTDLKILLATPRAVISGKGAH